MVLRPDEEAALAELRRDQNIRKNVSSGVSGLASFGVGALTGAAATGLVSKLLPFINKYVPTDLAVKGISKVSPKIGDFLKKGQSMGLNMEEGLNFIKEKLMTPNEETKVKENRNIIEQESPQLHQFIDQQIRGGRSPIEAGALAQMDTKRFSPSIDKLVKTHKTPWSKIIESVYGMGEKAPPQQQQPPKNSSSKDSLSSILAKINERLG